MELNLVDQGTDAELAAALRSGSNDALAELYGRHAQAVMRISYRICGCAADAEDVLQDVFIGLPEAVRAYRETGSFGGWLRQVATRMALMRRRRAASRAETAFDDDIAARAIGMSDDQIALQAAILRLPESLRLVFVLHSMEGHPHAAVAGLLGITGTASQVRHSRAMTQLKELMRANHD